MFIVVVWKDDGEMDGDEDGNGNDGEGAWWKMMEEVDG